MSKIKALPQNILSDITPYLVTDEKIEQALLQDNKKPNIIWLISTNQAIILHGQQPNQKPAIMVMALDEIKEIDYLQKDDDIQVVLYSGVNNSKAAFHFEPSAKEEVEKFFLSFGDLITYRYRTPQGKIEVVQRALPIGDKERHVFGRGKKKTVSESKPTKPQEKPIGKEAPPKETPIAKKESAAASVQNSASEKSSKVTEVPEKKDGQNKTDATVATQATVTKQEISVSQPKIQPKSSETAKEPEKADKTNKTIAPALSQKETKVNETTKAKKEIDYGNPIYFISITIISTAIGFFCLTFFKSISKLVKYFRKH